MLFVIVPVCTGNVYAYNAHTCVVEHTGDAAFVSVYVCLSAIYRFSPLKKREEIARKKRKTIFAMLFQNSKKKTYPRL